MRQKQTNRYREQADVTRMKSCGDGEQEMKGNRCTDF